MLAVVVVVAVVNAPPVLDATEGLPVRPQKITIAVSTNVNAVITPISRKRTERSRVVGIINPGNAITAKILRTLEPITLPIAMS